MKKTNKKRVVLVVGTFVDTRAVDFGMQDKQQTHYKSKSSSGSLFKDALQIIAADKSQVKPFQSWLTPKISFHIIVIIHK